MQTEPTGFLSEFVQFLAAGTGVHFLEGVVQMIYFLLGHAGVLADVRLLLLHLGVGIDGFLACHDETGQRTDAGHDGCTPVIDGVLHALEQRFGDLHLRIDLIQFSLDLLDLGDVRIPCRSAPLDVLEFGLQVVQSLPEVVRSGFVHLQEDAFTGLGAGLHLPEFAFGRLDLLVKLIPHLLIAGGSGLDPRGFELGQFLLDLIERPLCLLVIDVELNVCLIDICHILIDYAVPYTLTLTILTGFFSIPM